jgi:hypothetical protein
MKQCNCCNHAQPPIAFPLDGRGRRKPTCKSCYNGKERLRVDKAKHQAFNQLLRWGIPILVLVTGIYSYDIVSGRNRICFYESVYGTHAITIDAMNMCPMTAEFDYD